MGSYNGELKWGVKELRQCGLTNDNCLSARIFRFRANDCADDIEYYHRKSTSLTKDFVILQ